MSKATLLGVQIDLVRKDDLVRMLEECVKAGEKRVFAYAHIHGLNLAQKEPALKEFLNKADVVYCDGEGVRLGARLSGIQIPERIVLTRWIWELASFCVDREFSIFLLGGGKESNDIAVEIFKRTHPSLRIAGLHGYFEKSGLENEAVVRRINDFKPDIMFVGFGLPSQELWIRDNMGRISAKAFFSAGAMIEHVAGRWRSAPIWMRENGLEWVHRLMGDPRRLWKRYLIGNPMFMFNVVREVLRLESRK